MIKATKSNPAHLSTNHTLMVLKIASTPIHWTICYLKMLLHFIFINLPVININNPMKIILIMMLQNMAIMTQMVIILITTSIIMTTMITMTTTETMEMITENLYLVLPVSTFLLSSTLAFSSCSGWFLLPWNFLNIISKFFQNHHLIAIVLIALSLLFILRHFI